MFAHRCFRRIILHLKLFQHTGVILDTYEQAIEDIDIYYDYENTWLLFFHEVHPLAIRINNCELISAL